MAEQCATAWDQRPDVRCRQPAGHEGPHDALLFPDRPDWVTWRTSCREWEPSVDQSLPVEDKLGQLGPRYADVVGHQL